MAIPDHFEGEDCIITFEREESGVITNVDGKIMSWNTGGGSAPTEDIYTFGNKTFNFQKPREKFTVEFECILNSNIFGLVHMGAVSGATTPETRTNRLIMSSSTPEHWRVIMWLQSSSYHVKNTDKTVIVPSKAQSMLRMIFVDVKAVTFDKEFSAEEYAKGTLSLEFSATSSEGYSNYIEQEGIAAGTTSTVLASLTTTVADDGGNTGLLKEARGYLDWSSTTTPSWTAGTTTTRYRYA